MARTKTNDRKSNSFALFGDNACTVGSNNIDLFDKVVKKSKDTNVTEQYGSQHTDEKPESSKLLPLLPHRWIQLHPEARLDASNQ